MTRGTPWTDEDLAFLRSAWLEKGGMSAKEIGDKLGRTRNSVLGKLDRLGWKAPTQHKKITMRSIILSKKKKPSFEPVKKRRKRKYIPQPPYNGPLRYYSLTSRTVSAGGL